MPQHVDFPAHVEVIEKLKPLEDDPEFDPEAWEDSRQQSRTLGVMCSLQQ